MKILFIAYYYEPFPGIGAKRITYWAKNISKFSTSKTSYEPTIITATPQIDDRKNVFVVKEENRTLLSFFFKTDKGAYWLSNLSRFLTVHLKEHKYEAVIITGNPFLHFFITRKLKRSGAKVFLDFRDPFATNPRGNMSLNIYSRIKQVIMRWIEHYFVKSADHVITVNEQCAQLIAGYDKYKYKFNIVDNGFDESYFLNLPMHSLNGEFKFAYAGSLYRDRNPQLFIDVISAFSDVSFVHIGPPSEYLAPNPTKIRQYGSMSYKDTIAILNQCEVCMIFTSGHSFESTTKIFDYIALNKVILIVTDGEIMTGAIHEITKDYPNVYWSKNEKRDIEEKIKLIKENFSPKPYVKAHFFSRESGLKKIVSIL